MQTITSPYMSVQAIRRQMADAGHVTYAKPGLYHAAINLPANTVGETVSGDVQIEADSDFAWVSTYHYYQNGQWIPGVGLAGQGGSGELPALGRQDQYVIFDLRIENLSTGRMYHTPEWIRDLPYGDRWQGHLAGNPQGDEIAEDTAVLAYENNVAIGLWRDFLPEPELLEAGHRVRFTLRRRTAPPDVPGTDTRIGHLFILSGVRIFPGERTNVQG